MNTDRDKEQLRRALSLVFILLLLSAHAGCSLPKIVVLHDPLSAEEHMKLGSIYDGQGKIALARDQFREAAQRDSKNARAWSLLGETAYKMKEYGQAEKAYKKAIDLDPKSGDLRNNVAWVYVEQGQDLHTALEHIAKAIELTPEHRPYYLDTRGVALLKLGHHHEAVESLKEATETIPKDLPAFLAEAYGHLADAHRAAGDETAAREASLKRDQLLEDK